MPRLLFTRRQSPRYSLNCLFIHSHDKHLLSTYFMLSTAGTGDKKMNETWFLPTRNKPTKTDILNIYAGLLWWCSG